MTTAKGRVRSRRSVEETPVVAVTGAASAIGTAVLTALASPPEPAAGGAATGGAATGGAVARTVALDEVRGPVDGPVWKIGPLDVPDVVDRLRGADVVVHVAHQTDLAAVTAVPARARRAHAVRVTQAVTTAAAAVGARGLVVVSSALVLGARPDNPVPLPDDAPVAAPTDDGLVGDLLEVEAVLAAAVRAHPGLRVVVLRPAPVVGPGVDTIVTRHFEAPRLLTLRGQEMRWQFCHVDDLAAAVRLVVDDLLDPLPPPRQRFARPAVGSAGVPAEGPAGGSVAGPVTLTVGSPGSLSSDDVERISGMRRIEVPAAMAFATAERLHRVGVLPAPAGDLAYVVHPWVVAAAGLLDAGWAPSRTNEECLAVLLDGVRGRHAVVGRRLGTRDAAMGAAGAAVAVIGTAALVRRARSRR